MLPPPVLPPGGRTPPPPPLPAPGLKPPLSLSLSLLPEEALVYPKQFSEHCTLVAQYHSVVTLLMVEPEVPIPHCLSVEPEQQVIPTVLAPQVIPVQLICVAACPPPPLEQVLPVEIHPYCVLPKLPKLEVVLEQDL